MTETRQSADIVSWRVPIVCGVLWGLALAGLEMSVELSEWAGIEHFAAAFLGMAGVWCLSGCGWAIIATVAERRAGMARLIAGWSGGCFSLTLVQAAIFRIPHLQLFEEISNFPFDAMFAHVLWTNGFYGGLYIIGYVVFGCSVRSRRHVTRLHRLLSEEAASLSEAQLRAMRSQIQPEMLVSALATVKARYGDSAADADRLVDRLIAFLRTASAASLDNLPTLNGELKLATAYVQLQSELLNSDNKWTAEMSAGVPARFFPPRLLLPVIEEMGRKASAIKLSSGKRADVFYVQVTAVNPDQVRSMPQKISSVLDKQLSDGGASFGWQFATSPIDGGLRWTAMAAYADEHQISQRLH